MFFKKKEKNKEFFLGLDAFKTYFLGQKKILFYFFVINFVIYFSFTATPFITGKILDSLVKIDQVFIFGYIFDDVWFWLFILFFLGIVARTLHPYLFFYKIPKISNAMYIHFYNEKFKNIIKFPSSFFKNKELGKIIHSINTGAKSFSETLLLSARFFTFPTMAIFNFFFLFFISWKIGIFVLFFLIAYYAYFKITIEQRKKVIKNFNDSQKSVSNFLTEKINLIFEIKKNNKEKTEKKSLRGLFLGDFQKNFLLKMKFLLKTFLILDSIFFIAVIGVWFFVIFLYRSGEISIGDILAINIYAIALLKNMNNISENINSFVEKFVLIGDAEKLLQYTPENYTEGKISRKVEGKVEFKNVDFGYQKEQNPVDAPSDFSNKNFETKNTKVLSLDHQNNESGHSEELYESKDLKRPKDKSELSFKKVFSLKNINLKIEKGQKVAFVGESGGGKSTSVELIGGFYFPQKGDVFVDDISTKDINLNDLRSSIAYVSQDIAIFNTTIGENISYGLDKEIHDEKEKKKEIKKAAQLANISDFIDSLPDGYDTKVGEKGLKLSGGQKQRMAIARAILRNPKMLILDEPTSALDIDSETKITSALKEVMKGRTTIIIAHRISTIRDADKIFVFKDGQIVETGNYQNLIDQKGEFNKMVDLHRGLE